MCGQIGPDGLSAVSVACRPLMVAATRACNGVTVKSRPIQPWAANPAMRRTLWKPFVASPSLPALQQPRHPNWKTSVPKVSYTSQRHTLSLNVVEEMLQSVDF